jgi:4-amino-4-deoxychorismate lyase
MPEPNLLYAEAMEVVAKRADGVLKLIVTRGSGPRGYAPPETLAPMRIVFATPASVISATYACEGVAVRLCDTRLAVQPALAGIKHLNRLEQVLARAEWRDPQIAEGLMLDTDDNVIEGTMSNLFCVRDGALYTPELDRCGVRGITRERILEHARAVCLPAHEIRLRLDDLYAADELFICNTFMGIWPVRRLVGHPFVPGPVTRRLAAALEASND